MFVRSSLVLKKSGIRCQNPAIHFWDISWNKKYRYPYIFGSQMRYLYSRTTKRNDISNHRDVSASRTTTLRVKTAPRHATILRGRLVVHEIVKREKRTNLLRWHFQAARSFRLKDFQFLRYRVRNNRRPVVSRTSSPFGSVFSGSVAIELSMVLPEINVADQRMDLKHISYHAATLNTITRLVSRANAFATSR